MDVADSALRRLGSHAAQPERPQRGVLLSAEWPLWDPDFLTCLLQESALQTPAPDGRLQTRSWPCGEDLPAEWARGCCGAGRAGWLLSLCHGLGQEAGFSPWTLPWTELAAVCYVPSETVPSAGRRCLLPRPRLAHPLGTYPASLSLLKNLSI